MQKFKITLEQNQFRSLLAVTLVCAVHQRASMSIGVYLLTCEIVLRMQKRMENANDMNGLVRYKYAMYPHEWEIILRMLAKAHFKISPYDRITYNEILEQLHKLDYQHKHYKSKS